MSKGTIIYLGGFEFPNKNAAALRAIGIAKTLKSNDYDVVLIGVDKQMEWESAPAKSKVYDMDTWSIPYPKTLKQLFGFTSSINFFYNIVSKYKDVKLVICYDYQASAFHKIEKYCRKHNIKIVSDATEWYSSKGMGLIRGTGKKIDVVYRMRILQKRLDGVIVVTQFLFDYYKKHVNCVIIPPQVDITDEKWSIEPEQSADDMIRMVYAGSPGIVKDRLNMVVRSILSLPPEVKVHMNIIGVELEDYLKIYPEDRMKLEEKENRITFMGRLSHTDCLLHIKKADYYFFWRDRNIVTRAGFPSKLVESLTCGTPVLTTPTSDIDKYLQNGKNGYLLNFDDKKAAKQLQEILMSGKDHANEMKQYCKGRTDFYYKNHINMMKEFLNKVMGDE